MFDFISILPTTTVASQGAAQRLVVCSNHVILIIQYIMGNQNVDFRTVQFSIRKGSQRR